MDKKPLTNRQMISMAKKGHEGIVKNILKVDHNHIQVT